MSMSSTTIHGIGSALPERVVRNDELEVLTGFPAARILEMFEVEERRWSRGVESADPPEGQRCSDLAAAAALAAIANAGVGADDIGAMVTVTTTPDSLNPPFDNMVARKTGLLGIPAFSLHAPCTGVFRAVALAAALLPSLAGRLVLVVAAETPSPFFRFGDGVPTDHVLNSVLYADGAGALLLGRDGAGRPRIGRLDLRLNVETEPPGVTFPGMLSATPPSAARYADGDYLGRHDFRRVLRVGGKLAADAALRILEDTGASLQDVRWLVTHQATGNMHRIGASHGLPPEKIPVNIGRVGNTVSASILILLDELSRTGRLAPGDLLVLHTAESSTWSSAAMTIHW
jgi:3-oxoacyl-[acyl-carrier-protein] synthase III